MSPAPLGSDSTDSGDTFLHDRVARALGADYRIENVLGAGGMGYVLRAHHLPLDRPVAIKVLRPEQATAAGVARFLAEARLLARLQHPNVVSVYDAGESQGLLYFVMEYIEGETLAVRLLRGPLSDDELGQVSHDLLTGLAAAHRLGIVHRDIKPSNVFLQSGRALVADFGIARSPEFEASLTGTGQPVGTPRYMAPEQHAGHPVSPSTDVYALGLLLWEARTGNAWPTHQDPGQADWTGWPRPLARALRQALALSPGNRFADAGAFQAALARRGRSGLRIGAGLGVLAIVALGVWLALTRSGPLPTGKAGPLLISIAPFDPSPGLGDSVAVAVADALTGYPDFHARVAAGPPTTGLAVKGSAVVVGDSVRVSVFPVAGGSTPLPTLVPVEGLRAEWRSVADSVAVSLAHALWEQQPDATGLARALPSSRAGFSLWFRGEQLWSRAEWEAAGRAYAAAEQRDSTCLLCSYRLLDIARWLAEDRDPARLARVQKHVAAFPPHYQGLIRAAAAELPGKLDSLRQSAAQNPEFFLATFEYGDELMHRGPLYGGLRDDALEPLRRAVGLRPGFGPALEHYAWLLIWKGDTAGAYQALSALGDPGADSGFTAEFRLFLRLGAVWRFRPADSARALTRAAIATPDRRNDPLVGAGARLMMTLDAPRAAVDLGEMVGGNDGLLGRLFGFAALGALDSVYATGLRFGHRSDPTLPLMALELGAILRAFDPDSSIRKSGLEGGDLNRFMGAAVNRDELRRRAAWASGILAVRSGDRERLAAARRVLADELPPRALSRIIDAADRGGADPAGGLALLPQLPALERGAPVPDPAADAVVRLLRAEWLARIGRLEEARRGLRWHEHLEAPRHGTGDPQPGEIAWALGGLVSWLRAGLLARMVEDGGSVAARDERCAVNRRVAQFWETAPTPFRERAARARLAMGAGECRST